MTDIKSHIEAIRSIFKKRFSGEFSNFNGSKSPNIFKGKDDLEENFDWKNYGDELDKFDDEIYEYIDEKKLNSHTVEEIMKNFESTGKNFDKKIAWEIILIKKLHGKQKKFKKIKNLMKKKYKKQYHTKERKNEKIVIKKKNTTNPNVK